MRTLNIGILAHVDAGKTTLTERLLYAAGVIDEVGSVDDGSTQTDTLWLERQRGITIKAAVVSFAVGDVTVNLIDTPGHPDFIAEVERVLSVLDGAVLVISAVEGVQAQTRVLMRTLRRLGIPTLLFVNKADRAGAGYERVLERIAETLTPAAVAMGSVIGLGARAVRYRPFGDGGDGFAARLLELLAEHDEELLAAYVDGGDEVPYRHLRALLADRARRAKVYPVFFGSAVTGAGVDELTGGIAELLPAGEPDADGPVSGTVFKVERGRAGEQIAYVRMFSGTIRARDRLAFGTDRAAKVTAISVFDHGTGVRGTSVAAGRIAKLWGLSGIRIGDVVTLATDANGVPATSTNVASTGNPTGDATGHPAGTRRPAGSGDRSDPRSASRSARHHFAPPSLESVVVPARPADKGRLHAALTQLTEQDPLIDLRQDDVRQEVHVSLYGEIQKEVIQATLARDYGLDVTFRETTTICVERPAGTGAAAEVMNDDDNPFLATVGLRVEPAPVGSGVAFRLEVELGSMPYAFFKAVQDTVTETLRQGLYGWEVTDCAVTLTHSGYAPRQSHAHQGFSKAMSSTGWDFRGLTPLVLMDALRQAGTQVHEPMHRFRAEIPADTFGAVAPVLLSLRASLRGPRARGSAYVLEGELPAAQVHQFQQQLPGLTRGEGVCESAFAHHQPAAAPPPTRPRTDHNPLDRKEYLLHFMRRI